MALAAGKKDDMNALTISWGTIGNLWNKPIMTVFISTDRYTFEFMERNHYFTVTAFPKEYRKALAYVGSHSGRNSDKLTTAGLMVEYSNLGNPLFSEGRLVIECRKIYSDQFRPDLFNEEVKVIYNKGMGIHHFYIGEIINVWLKEINT